jgi:hypothetical protein
MAEGVRHSLHLSPRWHQPASLDVCFVSPTPVERHACASRHPVPIALVPWIPAFAGMTRGHKDCSVYMKWTSSLTRPTPTAARCLSPFVAGGTAPFNRVYALQALAIQVRRGNPCNWHRFCLSVHRRHGVPTLRPRHTDGVRPSLEETAILAFLCSKAPRFFASNFLGAA